MYKVEKRSVFINYMLVSKLNLKPNFRKIGLQQEPICIGGRDFWFLEFYGFGREL